MVNNIETIIAGAVERERERERERGILEECKYPLNTPMYNIKNLIVSLILVILFVLNKKDSNIIPVLDTG